MTKSFDEFVWSEQGVIGHTADIVLIALNPEKQRGEVLLVQRSKDPFGGKWALPGGFVSHNETLKEAARRELAEETNISDVGELREIGTWSRPDRDPRGRVISTAFVGVVERKPDIRAGSDAKNVRWFSLNALPSPLAFDHEEMVERALRIFDLDGAW